MYLRDLSRSLARRWYFVVAGLVVLAGLGLATYTQVPPTYAATANAMLLPPASTVEPGGNPYLYLGGLGQALDVVSRSLNSSTTRGPIEAANPSGTYNTYPDTNTSGPILVIDSTASTAEATLAILDAALATVPTELAGLQTQLGVAPSAQITSLTLTVDQEAATVGKGRLRAVVAVVAVGTAALALLIGMLDSLLLDRQRAKELVEDQTAAAKQARVRPPKRSGGPQPHLSRSRVAVHARLRAPKRNTDAVSNRAQTTVHDTVVPTVPAGPTKLQG